MLQIEEIQEYFDKDTPYNDLVNFENDIAQLSDLVLLFSEGPGSFAELGAFTTFPGLAEKLLVVIQTKYLSKASFVLKGPIAFLRGISDQSVFSITNTQTGIKGSDFSGVKPGQLLGLLTSPIELRLKEAKDRTTFLKKEFAHRCKLYVALLREFSALKDAEIIELFRAFNITLAKSYLERIAFCCRCVQWTGSGQVGFDRVHYALDGNEAARLTLRGEMKDKIRRRMDIRKYWQDNDSTRLAVQVEATA